MDTKTLITEAKARFNHNSAKSYLKEKYNAKLLLAEQGGLWRADATTISLLRAFDTPTLVLNDTFDNPVEVDRPLLLEKLTDVYTVIMSEYYAEWKHLEAKR